MADELGQILADGLADLPVPIDAATREKLIAYVHLLDKWNRAYNLTAVREPTEMVVRHLLDSLVVAPYLRGPAVLDVGTGAGLPGIPLALACPELNFTLLDSNGKKIRFVTQAVAVLGLANADVIQSRVEAWQPAKRFDTIIARAYSNLAGLVTETRHLLAEQGRYLLMKGIWPTPEAEDLPAGFRFSDVQRLVVPGLDAARHVVIIEAE
ncbi:MAG: 16S rRNA (guanine(527)-N(7))-methyltransferase RsmG [Proteobacteria bacterium]|jgi:16S rRNA (guanine527-N7)-methyltransferase|nr:16S rRNA (guanine(527)-N(7))-methyltransferase RsmG [Pseudomonadota bacterium]